MMINKINIFKLSLILGIILLLYSIFALSYKEGIEFIRIDKKVPNAPRVVEFFSFYCTHCYQFESIYQVSHTIANNLPKDIKMERYHVDFLGPLGNDLTKAWTVATVLKVEDKVIPYLFEGIQKKDSINTPADIQSVFVTAGIKIEEYNTALDSFIVKSLVIKQQKAAEYFKLRGVPAIFVNGKYLIRNNGLMVRDINYYKQAYSDVVNYLLNK